ncbi:peptidylprolyl isomerase [Candidatus Thioglobus sp.]|jgi:FKBP-type peptidyl-prolyl cis-trans isomerase SlyD|uniref:FKBP-type peptidyl-prolyl cis-trans isomerase n=1 Tax=Candidatus Thioglobus sp. TaxID=2026721 RepID=UPI00175ADDB1|nr:peptidylprolyl isomerase [Candidatus Thioglobus sp.]HIF47916.1 peptidylprolyl isomerase [Candidatus Thioglobus sp.]
MTVKKDAVVEMHYTLKNDAGEVVDSSKGQDPMPFIQGRGNIIPGLEKELEGMKAGDTCDVSVKPEDGYGVHHAEGIQEIPKEALQGIENIEIGMELQSQDEQGNPFIVRVEEIKDDVVIINANHPLAGQTLHFNVSIESVREATADELEHGHVHSASCSH